MKKTLILAALLAVSTPLMASIETDVTLMKQDKSVQVVEQFDIIVKFKDKSIHNALLVSPDALSKLEKIAKTQKSSISSVKETYNVKGDGNYSYGVNKLSQLGSKNSVAMTHVRSMSMGADVIRVESSSPITVQNFIVELINSGDFEDVILDAKVSKMNYDDPLFDEQVYMMPYSATNPAGQNYLGMRNLTVNNLGRKLRVGVADSGYAPHEDINELVEGYDFSTSYDPRLAGNETRDSDPTDIGVLLDGSFCHDGHGLSVAGLIAAKTNNGLGVAGGMNDGDIDVVYARVLDCFGNGSTSSTLDSVSWLSGETVPNVPNISSPVDVINLSLGGYSSTGCTNFEQAYYTRTREKGIVVVVAAGNSNSDAKTFSPAACNDVITVGASSKIGDKASFSNFGENIDVLADGDAVWMLSNTDFGNSELYFRGSGTSMSAPNISAAVGNLLLTYPTLNPDQVENLLVSNGRGYKSNTICGQLGCGSGVVDMLSSMEALPTVLTSKKFTKKHKYENYNSYDQAVWLDKMNTYANTCNMIKYTWGQLGSEFDGIEYKLYITDPTQGVSYTETVTVPQKVLSHGESTTVSVQACQSGSCGSIVKMTGAVMAPASCLN